MKSPDIIEAITPDFLDPASSGRFSTLSYLIGGHADYRNSQTGLFGVEIGHSITAHYANVSLAAITSDAGVYVI